MSPCLFNIYAEYIMQNVGLDEARAESRLQGEISMTSEFQITPPLWKKGTKGTMEEELNSFLMKMKEESEKASLKLNIQKTKIMVSSPITSWQIDGETMETVIDFNFLGSKITLDCDCGHEIKRCLLIGRKVVINLHSILKSRDITLLTKVCLVKVMAFLVLMYGCESWTIKKAECQKNGCFGTVSIPSSSRRSNQSNLKKNQP